MQPFLTIALFAFASTDKLGAVSCKANGNQHMVIITGHYSGPAYAIITAETATMLIVKISPDYELVLYRILIYFQSDQELKLVKKFIKSLGLHLEVENAPQQTTVHQQRGRRKATISE